MSIQPPTTTKKNRKIVNLEVARQSQGFTIVDYEDGKQYRDKKTKENIIQSINDEQGD